MFTVALDETVCANGEQVMMIDVELTHDIDVTRQQNRNYALAEGFQRMVKKSNCWALFLRYQAQAERLYRRAIEEFERLKKLRPELPNEPISGPEPEPVQEAANEVGQAPPPGPDPRVGPPSPTALHAFSRALSAGLLSSRFAATPAQLSMAAGGHLPSGVGTYPLYGLVPVR
jgi:hypothetical protein